MGHPPSTQTSTQHQVFQVPPFYNIVIIFFVIKIIIIFVIMSIVITNTFKETSHAQKQAYIWYVLEIPYILKEEFILANFFKIVWRIFLKAGDKHYNAMELSALEIFRPKSC